MRYIDCIATIKDERNVNLEYEGDGGKIREVSSQLGPDPFARLTVERLNYWVNYALKVQELEIKKKLYDIKDLRVIGLNLYNILFGDGTIEEGFSKARKRFDDEYRREKTQGGEPELRMRLKLVFMKEAEKLGTLPWEFLFVPGPDNDVEKGFFFAGQKTELILTRYVPESELVKGLQTESGRLKVLVVISSPQGVGTIDERETQPLIGKIKELPNAEVKDCRNLTYDQLSAEIGGFKPHILHFIGHGRPGELAFVLDKEAQEYDLDKGGEQETWIPGEQFRFLFNQHKPRLVFLHACKGAVPYSLEGFNSIARELVYAEIPAVVAMQYSISNQDAGKFARRFYQELGDGHDIDEAVKAGRLELGGLYPPWAHPRFGTPVVYLQTDKAIVTPPKPVEARVPPAAETAAAPVGGVRISPNVIVVGTAVEREASAQATTAPAEKPVEAQPQELVGAAVKREANAQATAATGEKPLETQP